MRSYHRFGSIAATALLAATALTMLPAPGGVSRANAQAQPQTQAAAAEVDARVEAILASMSLDQKIAQVIQPDTASFSVADMAQYRFGSYLSGGNSGPGGDERAPAERWLALADANWDAAMTPRADGRRPIPTMWAIDALHGHNNIIGATIFPHNIGLGATRDPALIRAIGAATATEIAVTGIDWTFAPTLAVVRDPRWGRTYESYSENPEVVAAMAGAMVEGLQGAPGTSSFLGPDKVIATAKHFIGDGGTGGKDQGDTVATEAELKNIHAAGYRPAIASGVETVMASFSSVNGVKMHGDKALLTGYLRGDLGFKGLVLGDWNGHGQVPGCSVGSCAASFNAGLDIFMAPDSWKPLFAATTAQVKSGEISMARLDEAVRRILRVKVAAGLFDKGKPSSRPLAGKVDLLASPDHRALARRAVRESLVLLKNNGNLLPLKPGQNVLVAGDGADSIPMQAGGWTISWQGGGDLSNADFPHADSIYRGIADSVKAAGGTAQLSADGSFAAKPDVAIVVFGEKPYAEFMGDLDTLEFHDNFKSYKTMQRLRAAGVPVVAVFLSGRPLWVNPELNMADAFVAAFLPGSEGDGVADMLFRNADGSVAHEFRGKLSFTWPNGPMPPKIGAASDPGTLFPFGYGLTSSDHVTVGPLSEKAPVGTVANANLVVLSRSGLPAAWYTRLSEGGGKADFISSNAGRSASGVITMRGIDRNRQEDARLAVWRGGTPARLDIAAAKSLDLAGAGKALVIDWRVVARPSGRVRIGVAQIGAPGGPAPVNLLVDATSLLTHRSSGWQTVSIPLRCLGSAARLRKIDTPFVVETNGSLSLAVSGIRIAPASGRVLPCPGRVR
ncbi:MAG: exo 1,3/1,4-beta-D-glucan glucohydrolase [Sphingomonas sp.]|uniref:glycoside hydrolase family 3 protein n=1 Tax=Sphingomonas sp. TaxID=28214 RepID=UPI0025F2627B|nr:glycoside hydrolase family 3 protein [Sphingomonas sp.]MBY0285312.1 exo 1,3/1,4-beta-D-glucan glucohydrolase [Sphingomonas sp.]